MKILLSTIRERPVRFRERVAGNNKEALEESLLCWLTSPVSLPSPDIQLFSEAAADDL